MTDFDNFFNSLLSLEILLIPTVISWVSGSCLGWDKTSIVILADSSSYNSSINPTFTIDNEETFITEIGIFSNAGDLVATGKPTYPINKSNGRFLAFKLEYDF